jgi:hypothetical protein
MPHRRSDEFDGSRDPETQRHVDTASARKDERKCLDNVTAAA